jgi:L-glyceraldehyde 3-phosphate reductase
MTSALVGASSVKQVEENIAALDATPLTDDELQRIESVLAEPAGVA